MDEYLGQLTRTINRRIVSARRVFRQAEKIPDRDRKITESTIAEMRRMLGELEDMLS